MYRKDGSLAKKLIVLLEEKSSEALRIAKDIMLAEPPRSKQTRSAMNYYIKNWYNIIHPGLICLSGEAVDADPNMITQAQVAMLMLTAALDIQDDIIDRSLIKNGKRTIFGKYGIETAILVGNAFLVKAFLALRNLEISAQKLNKNRIFDLIGQALYGLGNAHALEVELRRKRVSIARYWKVVRMKAAFFSADTELGATIGKASAKEIEILKRYGQNIGELVVLRDDFIDVFEADELRNRIKNEVLPMPVLYALKDKGKCEKLRKILSKSHIKEDDIDLIVDYIFKAKSVARLMKKMQNLAEQNIKILEELRESQSKILLKQLTIAMLEGISNIKS